MKTNSGRANCQITIVCFGLLVLALPNETHAQFTGNNQTNIISGVTSNWPGDYYVGSNYVFDALLIQNGGALSNVFANVGYKVGANSNTVIVSGSGSTWTNARVIVGNSGAGNSLVISNGGLVVGTSTFGDVIGYETNANNNTAVVTGLGSMFYSASILDVGFYGARNTLVISNGGAVVVAASGPPGSRSSVGGYGGISSVRASNNTALVTGSGSLWSNSTSLIIGNGASGSRLVISAGASVISSNGTIGANASNNSVLVTGSGSVWNNSSNLVVGDYGNQGATANSLLVSNGGAVFDGSGYVGGFPGSSGNGSNNSALVTGSGSVWSNSLALYVGFRGNGNNLVISNGGKVLANGTNYPSGTYLGSGSSNSVSVTGNDSLWSSYGGFTVSGSGNRVVVSNGGKVINNQPSSVGGSSNTLLVAGSGSVWSNNALSIGANGAGNAMVISNGGAVFNPSDFDNAYIGGGGFFGGSGSNNTVVVTGTGSVWNNNGELFVGFSGSGNELVIRNGGAVVNRAGWIGYCDTSGGCDTNSVLVTDPGSVWTNKCANGYCGLFVGGPGGRRSSLVISNGGRVVSTYRSEVGSKSSVLVTGDDSVWTSAGTLFIEGTVTFNGGTISADSLVLYETLGRLTFNRGLLNSASTGVTNAQQFVVGDGTNSATFHLLGGEHSFTDGLRIRTNSFLTGCGTINGSVLVDAGGTVLADCGGTLTFTGSVTNNGVMVADNGSILESSGTLVNNGTILLLDSSTANFSGTFINNGLVLEPEVHLAIERDGSGGFFIRYTGAPDATYRLQRVASLTGTWTNLATNTAPASGLIEYHDTSPLPGQAFYRTAQP